MVRKERDFRIAGALQNLFMHLAIATRIAAVAALRVDDQLAGCPSGRQIVIDRPALELKRAVNRVQRGTQGEIDLGMGRIEFKN